MESRKKYKSTKEYSKKYNKININVQLDRELILKIREKIKGSNISLKEYIENIISEKL